MHSERFINQYNFSLGPYSCTFFSMAVVSLGKENLYGFIAFLFSVQPCLIRLLQWLQSGKLACELFVSLSVCLTLPQVRLVRSLNCESICLFFLQSSVGSGGRLMKCSRGSCVAFRLHFFAFFPFPFSEVPTTVPKINNYNVHVQHISMKCL